jgi:ABC-2 type transport system permease protein
LDFEEEAGVSFRRIFIIMKKSLNPRNPYIIFAFLGPLFYALIFQFVFGLWKLKPTVAVYDMGDNAIVRELEKSEAIELVEADFSEEVRKLVEEKKVDIGVIFPKDTKESLATGEKFTLKIYVNGDSLARSRAIAAATIINTLRELSPKSPSITFNQVRIGEEKPLTMLELLLPFFVIIVIVLGSYMLPASFIVNEREKRTLYALLVTPVSYLEIILGFGIVGITISLAMGMLLLLLTVGITQPSLLLLTFLLGSILGAEWGLTLGLLSKDQTALVANMKALNLFIMAPAIIMLFPNWPQWIAKIFPTYYIANPIFRITIYGEGWNEVGWQILLLIGFIIIFFLPLITLSKRIQKA